MKYTQVNKEKLGSNVGKTKDERTKLKRHEHVRDIKKRKMKNM